MEQQKEVEEARLRLNNLAIAAGILDPEKKSEEEIHSILNAQVQDINPYRDN